MMQIASVLALSHTFILVSRRGGGGGEGGKRRDV